MQTILNSRNTINQLIGIHPHILETHLSECFYGSGFIFKSLVLEWFARSATALPKTNHAGVKATRFIIAYRCGLLGLLRDHVRPRLSSGAYTGRTAKQPSSRAGPDKISTPGPTGLIPSILCRAGSDLSLK